MKTKDYIQIGVAVVLAMLILWQAFEVRSLRATVERQIDTQQIRPADVFALVKELKDAIDNEK